MNKKLILFLGFLSLSLMAQSQTPEIFTPEDSKQIVSTVKDIEIKGMLEKTQEFKECRDKYPFSAGDTDSQRTPKIQAAQKCFQEKLSRQKDPKVLQELSDNLGLQQYGLVKSKNIKDIQTYLNNKMYQSMTGVNPDEADKKKLVESLKFKNKKHIDQRIFITLYKTQVSKNALYEVSRFCFEDLREEGRTEETEPRTFGEYWQNFSGTLPKVTDIGTPKFSQIQNPSDKDQIYTEIFNGINISKFPKDSLSSFFMACGRAITTLCDEYKKTTTANVTTTESKVDSKAGKGSAACLARARLIEYKGALAKAEKIDKFFAEEMVSTAKQEDMMKKIIRGDAKIFGAGGNDESLDSLTNFTSKDFLEGNNEQASTADAATCERTPEYANCEKFFSERDGFTKAKEKIELEMTLKREVEMARVKELKNKNDSSLDDYLKENGFFDILDKYKSEKWDDEKITAAVGEEFEARKQATLEQINSKMGKRQASKSDDKKTIETNAKEVVKENKEERARLAQVVMFNNIITSQLELSRKDEKGNSKSAGRNINAWKKEEEVLKNTSIDQSLFENLKAKGDPDPNGIGQNDQIGGADLIDQLLGK